MRSYSCVTSLAALIVLASGVAAYSQSTPPVERWKKATFSMTDSNGKKIIRTVSYPLFGASVMKAAEQKTCWKWCQETCGGYGICFVACGWECSPWTN